MAKRIYKCTLCTNTTDEDIFDLVHNPDKSYTQECDRIGWSAYMNGDKLTCYCPDCRGVNKNGNN